MGIRGKLVSSPSTKITFITTTVDSNDTEYEHNFLDTNPFNDQTQLNQHKIQTSVFVTRYHNTKNTPYVNYATYDARGKGSVTYRKSKTDGG